jgi:hypothetical protein
MKTHLYFAAIIAEILKVFLPVLPLKLTVSQINTPQHFLIQKPQHT